MISRITQIKLHRVRKILDPWLSKGYSDKMDKEIRKIKGKKEEKKQRLKEINNDVYKHLTAEGVMKDMAGLSL